MTRASTEVVGVIGEPSADAYASRLVATPKARRTAGLLIAGVLTLGRRTSTTPLSGRLVRAAAAGAWS